MVSINRYILLYHTMLYLMDEKEREARGRRKGSNLVFAILGRDRKRFEKMLLITFFEDRSKVLQRHLKLRSFEKPCFVQGLEMCKLQQEISGTRNDACSAKAALAQI